MTFKKYPLDGRKYYGEEKHQPQKEFLKKLHKDKKVHKKISNTLKEKYKLGIIKPTMLNKHHSIKTKKNHSILMKDKYKNGLVIHNKGKTTDNYEPLKRMGLKTTGSKNHMWNGGTSFEPYGKKFNKKLKKQIRIRDNFTCQECSQNEEQLGCKLSIHHIDYNKQNNNPNNLISLCNSCHSQTNFSRDNWINYFQEKLNGV